MSLRRRSTVHDLAALRLHPDGTRVHNSDNNRTLRKGKYSVRDARGNWIARDAGGLGTVKQRRTVRSDADTDEDRSQGEEHDGGDGTVRSETGRKGKERATADLEGGVKDPRARKRRRFVQDLSFLDNGVSTGSSQDVVAHVEDSPIARNDINLPNPSSDLLKCIHHFATTYYSAMGQLHDGSREARKQRKLQRLERLRQQSDADGTDGHPRTSPVEGQDSGDNEGDPEITTSEDEELQDDEEADEPVRFSRRTKVYRRSELRRNVTADMYKIFDGSALMAIGMLVQEHIGQMLTANIPEGWEQEVAALERSEQSGTGNSRRNRKRGPRRKRGMFGSDEEEAEETADEVSGGQPGEPPGDAIVEKGASEAEGNKPATRGVVQPHYHIPYEDDDSNDESYIPP